MAAGQVPSDLGSVEASVRDQMQPREARQRSRCWTRALAAVSLTAGAVLVARGSRRPGLIATAAGVMIVLLEHPEDVGRVWGGIPHFIETSRHLLDRTQSIVEDLTRQAETARNFLDKATGNTTQHA